MSRLRILRIADIPDNRTGGMSRTMYCTGDILQERGHQVDYLFSPAFKYRGRVQLRRFFVPLEVPQLVRKQIETHGPYDVVEVHEPMAAPYAWQRQRDRSLPPLVIFSYGLEERSHEALLHYKRLKHLPVSLKNRWSPLTVVWQARYAVRHADHVICSNSEDVRHLEAAGLAPERLTRHHSGADSMMRAAEATPADPMRSGILFLGSWLMRKGILDVIPAVTNVLRAQPTLTFTVAGCGAGAEEVLSAFPAELRNRIQVIPHVSEDRQLIELYRRHSIFVLPSFFEGQPLVMIEAAVMGLAIVTTRVCGMIDFIQDGKNGLLIDVGDEGALAQRLEQLVANPARARELGEAARQTAQTHTWATAATKIEAAYRQAMVPDK
jgi:glycosyltransferase involved in cell wall biosynthesis